MSSGAVESEPGVVRYSATSFDGTLIRFDVYEHPGGSTVLVVPGFWRDRKHASMERLAAFLGELGYRAAVCDLRGHGESGGTFGFNRDEHEDVAAVIRALVDRGAGRVALIGLSYGGAIAISTAARHPELPISGMILISPVADFARLAPRINPLTIHRHVDLSQALRRPRFEWRFSRGTTLRAIDDIGRVHVPISLIHVKDDWLVNHGHSTALFALANEPKELHILDVPGNYHADRIFEVAASSVKPLVAEFLARTTQG